MKIVFSFVTILLVFTYINCQGKDPRGFERTPKALDLDDHFGTEAVQNLYGPQARAGVVDLAREYDSVDGVKFTTPITNFAKEIKPTDVVHGDLTNTAYDASKIIKPEYAHPKAEIDSKFVHEAIISTPVQLGTQHTAKMVSTANRLTGEISEKVVNQNKPIVGVVKNLRQVTSSRKTFVDIQTGKLINTQKPTLLHGMSQ